MEVFRCMASIRSLYYTLGIGVTLSARSKALHGTTHSAAPLARCCVQLWTVSVHRMREREVPGLINLVKKFYTLREPYVFSHAFSIFKSWHVNEQHNPDDSVVHWEETDEDESTEEETPQDEGIPQFVCVCECVCIYIYIYIYIYIVCVCVWVYMYR